MALNEDLVAGTARANDLERVFWDLIGVVHVPEIPDDELIVASRRPPATRPIGRVAVSESRSLRPGGFGVDGRERPRQSTAPPPWSITFSHDFVKETRSLDMNLMGRILVALKQLSLMEFPFSFQGDTLKPLTGDLKGKWRYRLGQHRLLIEPIVERATIDAIAVGPRGCVYD